jgi:hypothetical protein
MIRLTHRNEFDVAVNFSQDQDLAGAVTGVREVAKDHQRHMEMIGAFPFSSQTTNPQPISGTTAFQLGKSKGTQLGKE